MALVELNLPHHRYQIHIAPGALQELGARVKAVAHPSGTGILPVERQAGSLSHGRAALLADANVIGTHVPVARRSLESAGYQVVAHPLAADENHKSLDTVRQLYEILLNARLERRSPVIALGGGITGDVVGFVASTYLRGVPFVQCPTTLLAMVDASIGGKVGVNVPQGKNLIGSFYQPCVVVIDTDTLTTLPRRELRCGLAECIKHGVIRDPRKFEWLELNLERIFALDPATLVELVRWNVQIKANVVMADEKETGERAHLNFGHTFAHAIEATQGIGGAEPSPLLGEGGGVSRRVRGEPANTNNRSMPASFHHGEAVALGMVAATQLSVALNRCAADVLTALERLLTRAGLPTRAAHLPDNAVLLDAMQLDKKVAGGKLRLILPDRLGAVSIVTDVPPQAVITAWDAIRGK